MDNTATNTFESNLSNGNDSSMGNLSSQFWSNDFRSLRSQLNEQKPEKPNLLDQDGFIKIPDELLPVLKPCEDKMLKKINPDHPDYQPEKPPFCAPPKPAPDKFIKDGGLKDPVTKDPTALDELFCFPEKPLKPGINDGRNEGINADPERSVKKPPIKGGIMKPLPLIDNIDDYEILLRN